MSDLYEKLKKDSSEYPREYKVADKLIGEGEPTFVVAEAASNHMCDMELAKKMVDEAVTNGADAIKFQTYKAARLVRSDAIAYWQGSKVSQIEYYSKLDKFGHDEYKELFEYAKSKGIIPFSTPFDLDSATMLNQLGVEMFKIASCDLPDVRLIRHVASFGKPVVLSLGAAYLDEIDKTIEAFYETGNHQLVLLVCTLSYPTKNTDANLARIKTMKQRYPWMVIGLSDHTEPDEHMVIPSVAVSLGAKMIEKHYTLDRSMTGSGHAFSIEPSDLGKMVKNIRLTEEVLGHSEIGVVAAEEAARENARRSIVADININAGDVITSEMIGMKRPADGLPGYMIDEIIGKKAKIDIPADNLIMLENIH